jgi:hypothetical protein
MKTDSLTTIAELSDQQRADLAGRGVQTVGELYALLTMPLVENLLHGFLGIDLKQAVIIRRALEQRLSVSEQCEMRRSTKVTGRLGALLDNNKPTREGR